MLTETDRALYVLRTLAPVLLDPRTVLPEQDETVLAILKSQLTE